MLFEAPGHEACDVRRLALQDLIRCMFGFEAAEDAGSRTGHARIPESGQPIKTSRDFRMHPADHGFEVVTPPECTPPLTPTR